MTDVDGVYERFQKSGNTGKNSKWKREDLKEWLTYGDRGDMTDKRWEMIDAMVDLRNTYDEIRSANQIDKLPVADRVIGLKDTSVKDKIVEEYETKVDELFVQKIASAQRLSDIPLFKDIQKIDSNSNIVNLEKIEDDIFEKIFGKTDVFETTTLDEMIKIRREANNTAKASGLSKGYIERLNSGTKKDADTHIRNLIKRGILPEGSVLPKL